MLRKMKLVFCFWIYFIFTLLYKSFSPFVGCQKFGSEYSGIDSRLTDEHWYCISVLLCGIVNHESISTLRRDCVQFRVD